MTTVPKEKRSRRGRPSVARAKAIDQAILDAARSLFMADGFDAVAMEQVATTAQISKGTLYARYASKEALFTAIVEASVQRWSETAAQDDYLLTDDIGQRLRHHARTMARSLQWPDVVEIQRLIHSVRLRFPELSSAMHERGYVYIVDIIAADICDAAKRDSVPARDPSAIARMLVAGIAGFQNQEKDGRVTASEVEKFAIHLADVLTAGREAW